MSKKRQRPADWDNIADDIRQFIEETQATAWKPVLGYVRENFLPNCGPDGLRKAMFSRGICLKTPIKEKPSFVFLVREVKRLTAELEKREEQFQVLLDTVQSGLAKIPAPKTYPKPPQVKNEFDSEAMVALLSDLHVGMEVKEEHTAGLSTYNFATFKKRFEYWVERLIRYKGIYQSSTPTKALIIPALGDNTEGEDIFAGQSFMIDRKLVDAVFEGIYVVATGLAQLAQEFPQVTVLGVPGNHGRLGRKGQYYYKSNADYIFFKCLNLALKEYKNIKILTSECVIAAMRIENQDFLFAHGDQIQRWMNLPYYGLDRFVRRMTLTTQTFFRYVCMGHQHTGAEIDYPYGEKIINGAFPGASSFSINRLQEAGIPHQRVFGVHAKHGKTWSRRIDFPTGAAGLPTEPDAFGIYTPHDKGIALPAGKEQG